MRRRGRERERADISEAFDFARFVIKHPDVLRKVRSGSYIRIVPAGARAPKSARLPRHTQTFAAERVFRSI